MSKLQIVNYPAPILQQRCHEVTQFDKKLKKLLHNMYDTMVSADGVGLAAPQVNIAKRIAIVDLGDHHGLIHLINPVIVEAKGNQVGPEGCLSFPGLFGDVVRSYYVKVQSCTPQGHPIMIEAEDFLARAIQHEMDHLNGILFTEKVIRYYEEGELG